MHRPRYAIGFLLAPVLFTLVFFTFACGGGGPEQSVIQKFFQSSRLRDNMTLGGMALVAFSPNTDGIVENFSVVTVGEPQTQPLHLKELAKTLEEAKKASDDLNNKKRAYQDGRPSFNDDLKKYQEAERKGQKLKGKDAEFQVAWDKWRADTAEVEKKVSDAREALSAERGVADLSTNNPQNPIDPTLYDGEMTTKDYTINANIQTPDGKHTKKTLVVTLQQAKLKGEKGDITGKWIVTKIKEAAAGATS